LNDNRPTRWLSDDFERERIPIIFYAQIIDANIKIGLAIDEIW
jgi:hypothetical protein